MPRTRKMPAFQVQEQWKRDAERDARAFEVAQRTGVSFQEAWLASGNPPKIEPLIVGK